MYFTVTNNFIKQLLLHQPLFSNVLRFQNYRELRNVNSNSDEEKSNVEI